MPGDRSEQIGHPRDQGAKKGTHAVNVSNEQSPHSPLPARRFDRVARFPSRINTVVTARPASVTAWPSSRGHLAKEAGQTPKPRCPSGRRKARRETRVRIETPADPGTARRPIPVRHSHRDEPSRSLYHSQAHRRPEDGQRPDQSGPSVRHARDPRRQFKSFGMLSAPGLRDRLDLPLGRPHGTRGSKVLASFTISLERRSNRHAIIRLALRDVPRVEGPTPLPARIIRLLYQMPSAGQSPDAPGIVVITDPSEP